MLYFTRPSFDYMVAFLRGKSFCVYFVESENPDRHYAADVVKVLFKNALTSLNMLVRVLKVFSDRFLLVET